MPVDKVSPRSRSCQTFPRGTCWAFQGGRFCGGCRFPHLCFKCGSPHPASQCAHSAFPRPPVQPDNKQSPSAHPLAHQSDNPRKGGKAWFPLTWVQPRFLIDGFTFGFGLGFMGDERSTESLNLKSALSQPQVVPAKLEEKRSAGRIAGPFSSPPFPYFRCSPLGIVPKKDPSEFRSIHHLSYPKGSSINDYIPQEFSSVKYACINNAISVIKSFGAGCIMANTDIKSAFCIIPVHPKDHPLLAWNGILNISSIALCLRVVVLAAPFLRLLVRLSNGSPNIYFTPRALYTVWMIFCLLPLPERNARLIFKIYSACVIFSEFQ